MLRGLIPALVLIVWAASPAMAETALRAENNPVADQSKNTVNINAAIDPETKRYYFYLRDVINSNWTLAQEYKSKDLRCVVQIVIEPDGSISSMAVRGASGSSDLDETVMRAVKRSSPLRPLPPVFEGEALVVQLQFSTLDFSTSKRPLEKNNSDGPSAK